MSNGSGLGRGGRLATLARLAALMLVMAAPAVTAGHVGLLVAFDPAAFEFPEGIVADKTGNLYVSMTLLDQIRRIDQDGAQSVYAQLPPGAAPAGLKLDADGTLYVAAGGFNLAIGLTDPATRGVYRVRLGWVRRAAGGDRGDPLPQRPDLRQARQHLRHRHRRGEGVPGRDGRVGGAMGGGSAAGGDRSLWVRVPDRRERYRLPSQRAGRRQPGKGASGVDPDRARRRSGRTRSCCRVGGIAWRRRHRLRRPRDIYVGVNVQSTLVAVRTDGSIDTLATAAEGLNQPSTVAFGTGMGDRQTLFLVNLSILVPAPTPSVLEVAAGLPGQPVP